MSGNSIAEGIRRLEKMSSDMQKTPADLVAKTARTYANSIRSSIASVTTNNRLRGVGKFNGGSRKGARVGVKYDPPKSQGIGKASTFVQATGPLHLIERDNKDHVVPRATGSRRLRTASGRLSHKRESTGVAVSGRKPMLVGGVGGQWRTGPWNVKGSKGKHPFERGVRAADQAAQIDAIALISNTIGNVIRGGF